MCCRVVVVFGTRLARHALPAGRLLGNPARLSAGTSTSSTTSYKCSLFFFKLCSNSDLPLPPQGQLDLLKHARNEVQENLKQIHYAALTSNLSKGGPPGGPESKSRRSLEAIPEKATAEEELSDDDN